MAHHGAGTQFASTDGIQVDLAPSTSSTRSFLSRGDNQTAPNSSMQLTSNRVMVSR
jgi:hypothetical protein